MKKLDKKTKEEMYKPKPYALYENGNFISSYPSHSEAKKVKHRLIVEAYRDMLDLDYTIKPYNPKW